MPQKRLPVPWNTETLRGRGHLLGDIEVHVDIVYNTMTTAKYDNCQIYISFNSKTKYEESFLANLSSNDCLYILLPLCSYRPRHHKTVSSCSATTRARRATTTTIPESTINNSAEKDQEKPSSNSQPMIQQKNNQHQSTSLLIRKAYHPSSYAPTATTSRPHDGPHG